VNTPVFVMAVLRYADGTTVIEERGPVFGPSFHEYRHAMLVDALVEVNKERDREQSRSR
jgi:hypothetical protein